MSDSGIHREVRGGDSDCKHKWEGLVTKRDPSDMASRWMVHHCKCGAALLLDTEYREKANEHKM